MGSKEDLKDRKFLNKFGSYEDLDFVITNYYILALSGELGHFKNNNDHKIENLVRSWSKNIKNLIKKNEAPLWGWKDPSTIYTIPYIHEYLTNPYYISLNRNINDIVESILRVVKSFSNILSILYLSFRFLDSKTFFKMTWNYFIEFLKKANKHNVRHFLNTRIIEVYKNINSFVVDKKHLCLNLDDLIKNSPVVIKNISNFLEISPSDKQISAALSFIHPEIIHH